MVSPFPPSAQPPSTLKDSLETAHWKPTGKDPFRSEVWIGSERVQGRALSSAEPWELFREKRCSRHWSQNPLQQKLYLTCEASIFRSRMSVTSHPTISTSDSNWAAGQTLGFRHLSWSGFMLHLETHGNTSVLLFEEQLKLYLFLSASVGFLFLRIYKFDLMCCIFEAEDTQEVLVLSYNRTHRTHSGSAGI